MDICNIAIDGRSLNNVNRYPMDGEYIVFDECIVIGQKIDKRRNYYIQILFSPKGGGLSQLVLIPKGKTIIHVNEIRKTIFFQS